MNRMGGNYSLRFDCTKLYSIWLGSDKGATGEFMKWILSDAGQCIIVDKGYASVRDVNCG